MLEHGPILHIWNKLQKTISGLLCFIFGKSYVVVNLSFIMLKQKNYNKQRSIIRERDHLADVVLFHAIPQF